MIKEKWLNWRELIIDDRELSFGAKAMGLYLNTFMNSKNDFAYPSIAYICGEMSITDKTACKYINELVKYEYIAKQKRFSNSVIYHTTIPTKVKEEIASIGNPPVMDEIRASIGNHGVPVSEGFRPNKQTNKQTNKQKRDYPTELNKNAWLEYTSYRKEAKYKKLTKTGEDKQIEKIIGFGDYQTQQRCIDETISNGWQGIFAPKNKLNGGKSKAGNFLDRCVDGWDD